MKLAFITSGLEPGADGVGDYCRRLAQKAVEMGNEVAILALNDPRAKPGSIQWSMDLAGVRELRLSADDTWNTRFGCASEMLEEFGPDWISLHFVCYGFHQRGLAGFLANDLSKLLAGQKLHLMMHELWVMWAMKCRLSDRLIGFLQRRNVLNVVRSLNPLIMDTTIPFYQSILRYEGFECGIMPLCGNFSPVELDSRNWLSPILRQASLPDPWSRKVPLLVAGFFGTIFGHWDPTPMLFKLSEAAERAGKEILLLAGGKCSPAGEQLFDLLPERIGDVRIHKLKLGVLTVKQASEYLNTLDLGLTCYSKLFVGKSSTAATMLDHGLCILAGGKDQKLERIWKIDQPLPGVLGLDDSIHSEVEHCGRRLKTDSSSTMAIRFFSRLNSFS